MASNDPRAVLAAHAAARGDSLAALSAMLGRNAAYLQQYVKRGSPRVLAERDRRMLADYFGVGEDLFGGTPPRGGSIRIARLDVEASAGPGAMVDADILLGTDSIDAALVRTLGLRLEATSVIRVRGTSMEPGLFDGDHIFVDTRERTPRGGVYVIRIDGLTMVKRVQARGGTISVTSDNPDAPPVPDGRVEIIGRVVWQTRVVR